MMTANNNHEKQGSGYDPGAAGHERQGRASAPMTTPHGSQTEPNSLDETIAGHSRARFVAGHAWKDTDYIGTGHLKYGDLRALLNAIYAPDGVSWKEHALTIGKERPLTIEQIREERANPSTIADEAELVAKIESCLCNAPSRSYEDEARFVARALIASHAIRFTKP